MAETTFTFPISKGAAPPLHVYAMGKIHADPGFVHAITRLDGTTLSFVQNGHGQIRVGKETWEAGPGDVFIHHEGYGFHTRADAKKPWVRLWCWLGGRLVEELLGHYGLGEVSYLPGMKSGALLEKMYETAGSSGADPLEQAMATQTFGFIQALGSELGRRQSHLSPLVEQVRENLDAVGAEAFSVHDLAAKLGKSREWVIHEFKKEMGTTPYAYLVQRKIQKAKLLLANPGMTLVQVAEVLGFSDAYSFSAQFKKKVGLSPDHFRKNRHRLGV